MNIQHCLGLQFVFYLAEVKLVTYINLNVCWFHVIVCNMGEYSLDITKSEQFNILNLKIFKRNAFK